MTEGHPIIWSRIPRNPPLDPPNLDRSVLIVPTVSGDDGTLARAALATKPDGAVIGTLGAGHLAPPVLELWAGGREEHPGRGLLPPGARRDPVVHLRLRRLGAGPARHWPDPGRASSRRRPCG